MKRNRTVKIMKVASVGVLKVTGMALCSPELGYQMAVRILPDNKGTYVDLIGMTTLTCSSSTWNFGYTDRKECSICFAIFETKPAKKELARLTLPLKWFQVNTRVTEAFPCRMCLVEYADNPIMISVVIHLSENGELPFQAAPGKLLVKPAWKLPPRVFEQPHPKKKKSYGTYTKKDATDQSLGVPTLNMPDEDPLGSLGNQRLMESDLKPLAIGGPKPIGRVDTSAAEPLMESDCD